MMDVTCSELHVRLGCAATERDQRLPVCKQFVGTNTVLFQNTQIYIFLLYCMCIGVHSYCGDLEAAVTFVQSAVFCFHAAECSRRALLVQVVVECTVHGGGRRALPVPGSKPKDTELFGGQSGETHLGSQLGAKSVQSIFISVPLCSGLFPLLLRVQSSDWKDDAIPGVFSDVVFLAAALWWLE